MTRAGQRRATLLACLLLAWSFAAPAAFGAAPPGVFVDGVKVSAHPLIRDGVAYLPINSMAEALGVAITWDSSLNIVKVEGEVVAATPYPEDGKIYLPVESFVAAMGGSVTWDGRRRTIQVSTQGEPSRPMAARTVPIAPTDAAPAIPTVAPEPAPAPSAPSIRSAAYGEPEEAPTPAPPPTWEPAPSAIPAPPITGYAPSAPAPAPAPAPSGSGVDVFIPRSAQNSVFQVTVTNVESVSVIKDFYKPRTGYKFVLVYLSQQNISNEVQIYTGKLSLVDQKESSYESIEGLSNFWLVILRPYGINFGYLVYEIPADARPGRLVLHALNQSPLTVDL